MCVKLAPPSWIFKIIKLVLYCAMLVLHGAQNICKKKRFLRQHRTFIFKKKKVVLGSPKGIHERAVNQNPILSIVFEKNIIFEKILAAPFCFFRKRKLVLGSIKCAQYCAASANSKFRIVFEKQVTQKKVKKCQKWEFRKKESCAELCSTFNIKDLRQFPLRLIFSKITQLFWTWKYFAHPTFSKTSISKKIVLSAFCCARWTQFSTALLFSKF